jgi:hypothetical protein
MKSPENINNPSELGNIETNNKLNSLGIKYECSINGDGKLVYTFYDVEKLDHSAFLISSDNKKVIYQALHFGEDKFEEPGSKKEVDIDELVQYLSEKFPDADNIIFSCCNPDKAKTLLGEGLNDKITFIGTGSGTYSTWYNDRDKKLSSVRN